jgi:aspartate aminotransferase-like enzyme
MPKPDLVFAPHVGTAPGSMLPDAYRRAVGDAVHEPGGMFVLDCVASGAIWVDMQAIGVDVLVTAPQKGWSSQACAGLVTLGERARRDRIDHELELCLRSAQAGADQETYDAGSHAYFTTLLTDALSRLRDTMQETERFGFARAAKLELGTKVRTMRARYAPAAPGIQPAAARRARRCSRSCPRD